MKSVSIGTKSKSEVLENCLQQMKACFLDVSSFLCMYKSNNMAQKVKHRNCSSSIELL